MEKEYKELTKHFFKADMAGQIASLWRNADNKEKVAEYKKALSAGLVTINTVLTSGQMKVMNVLGIEVPAEFQPAPKPPKAVKEKKVKAPKAPKAPKPPKLVKDPTEVYLNHKQVTRLMFYGVTVPTQMLPLRGRAKYTPKVTVVETDVSTTVPGTVTGLVIPPDVPATLEGVVASPVTPPAQVTETKVADDTGMSATN